MRNTSIAVASGTSPASTDRSPNPGLDAADILAGLRSNPKRISPKYFYDERGSRLFEEICSLPEYYPTRTETAILEAHAEEVAARVGPDAALIEYGSGSSRKTRILLDALRPAYYAPVDISGAALEEAVAELAEEYPSLPMRPVCADYMTLRALPFEDGNGDGEGVSAPERKRLLFFPGSTIGNLDRDDALDLLRRMRRAGGPGAALVIGADLRKDRGVLERAYNDSRGVTAAFNLNLLRRLNAELGADFPVKAFAHRAFFNEEASRIEMHLQALRAVTVRIAGETVRFAAGETLHTESSYKYAPDEFAALLRRAGFAKTTCWTDARGWFGVFYAEAGTPE